ncbi:MAG TPA: TIGR03085 family metal-binding protein [Acidimicrobiales bacterium]|nr:TIGR03085 family metal-binding protein [Acidimicrobiales bacterium]
MHPSLRERAALCDLFEQLGPDAPTRCEGWRTTELAAHLHTREHRLDAGPGLLGRGPFARYTAKLEAKAADRPYDELVAELRDGPPRQWFGRYVPAGDIHEWFVHHEDVRRANGELPRLDDDLDEALWAALARWGKILTRKADVGVELVAHDGRSRQVKDGDESVILRGRPGEIMLALFGRESASTLEGSETAVAAYHASTIGL